ncbi:uncharacterized protein LOC116610719 [Nematostella vectensis]|uniref:uncharacterized protein LOC116610719 n=1 Tax=Nematostella vectensis TaxID=45351 RepID=UPI002077037B|nr:uncharacterized protein LOC116610719 [Nematostella vectensis]XP_048577924.1 uncharacterized protein LOC116610719 [Nematostella vectensis]
MAGLFMLFGFSLLLASFFTIAESMERKENERSAIFMKIEGFAIMNGVISEHDVTSSVECGQKCLMHYQCRSYNLVSGTLCQLLNVTKTTAKDSLVETPYSIHFYDISETFKSCLDFLKIGITENGIYTITGSDDKQFSVYCDFRSEPPAAWTLVMAFSRRNRRIDAFCNKAFSVDIQRNENNPNWNDFRLSLPRMQLLKSQSTHWRVTTGFPVYGVDYRDYVRGNFLAFDIMTFSGGGICKPVELVNIRGLLGTNTEAAFWQNGIGFHIDSGATHCQFKPNSGAVHSENNFGYYCESDPSMNVNFRGTKDDDSTTEYWFGGYA